MRNPPHPGAFIRTEILEPLKLTVTAGRHRARASSRVALSSLLNGQADLSGDMALRRREGLRGSHGALMRMQASYDIVKTRLRAKSITVRTLSTEGRLTSRRRTGVVCRNASRHCSRPGRPLLD